MELQRIEVSKIKYHNYITNKDGSWIGCHLAGKEIHSGDVVEILVPDPENPDVGLWEPHRIELCSNDMFYAVGLNSSSFSVDGLIARPIEEMR